MALPVIGGSDGAWGTTLTNFLGGADGAGVPTIPNNRIPYLASGNHTSSANLTFDGTTLTVGTLVVDTGSNFRVNAAGLCLINDTGNSFMTAGLTINQLGADNELFAGKSSDVAHGFTSIAEADTFVTMAKIGVTAGGMDMSGYSTATRALRLLGNGTTDDTTKSIAAVGYIGLLAGKLSGSNVGTPGADANMVVIADGQATTRFIFDVEGSGHADVAWTTFDNYDDLALMDAMQVETTNRLTPARHGQNSLYYNRRFLEEAGIIGRDSWHFEDRQDGRRQFRSMVNFTRLAMLHHGAILQVGDRVGQYEERIVRLERKLLELQ